MIATAMIAIIAAAASTFAVAVASGWRSGDDSFRLANLSTRSAYRVEDVVGASLYVLQAKAATATNQQSYLFCWAYDGITGVADGKAQLGEMVLVEYDPTAKAIVLRQPLAAGAMTAAQLATASASDWGDPTSPDVVTYFKGLDFVQASQTVIGGQTGASQVSGASFGFGAATGAKPMVTYSVVLQQGALTTPSQGTIVLHAARQPSNLP